MGQPLSRQSMRTPTSINRRSLRTLMTGSIVSGSIALLLCGPLGCKKDTSAASRPSGQTNAAGGPATEPPSDGGIIATSPTELTQNPAVVYDPAIAPLQFELYRVKLRDPASALPKDHSTPDESGWVNYKQENV